VTALSFGTLLIVLLSLAVGRDVYDPITNSMAFVGIFQSKNQLSLFADIMVMANLAIMFGYGYWPSLKISAGICIALDMYLLRVTESATSQIIAVLGPILLLGNYAVAQWKPDARRLGLIIVGPIVILLIPLAVLTVGGLIDSTLAILGRDTTLTGRTFLWERALSLIPQHLFFGDGFQTFWRAGYAEAEDLWRSFDIADPIGFNFHNTYLEISLGLGVLGSSIFFYFVMGTMIRVIRWSWNERSLISSFCMSLMAILLIRSLVEVEIAYQFQIGSLLFYMMMYYGYERGSRSTVAGINGHSAS
jgi:exopolysaccharide production protein ExoQ